MVNGKPNELSPQIRISVMAATVHHCSTTRVLKTFRGGIKPFWATFLPPIMCLPYKSNVIRYFRIVVTNSKSSLDAASYVRKLLSRGRFTFTLKQAMDAIKVSKVATRAALRRLKEKIFLATPARGFYVIVPPEYETLGCLPADQWISELMAFYGESYYVGLLSAAELHGAAHHKPQEFQVMVLRNRRMITCGRVTIRFIAVYLINHQK